MDSCPLEDVAQIKEGCHGSQPIAKVMDKPHICNLILLFIMSISFSSTVGSGKHEVNYEMPKAALCCGGAEELSACQPLRSRYTRALIWDQRGWCLSSAAVQAGARAVALLQPNVTASWRCETPHHRFAGLAELWTVLLSCCWDGSAPRQPAIPPSCTDNE